MNQQQIALYLRSVADDLPYRIYIKGLDRKFIWANKETLRACGFVSLESLKGMSDEDLFTNPHLGEAMEDDLRVLQGETITEKLEFETWRRVEADSGQDLRKLRLVSTTKQPIWDSNQIIGLVGISRDAAAHIPNFAADSGGFLGHRWRSGAIYYHNLKTDEKWCDDSFKRMFPGDTLLARWRHIAKDHHSRVARFLKRLSNPKDGHGSSAVTSSIDFRATVQGVEKWIRGDSIVFGPKDFRTLIVSHRDISEEAQGEALSARALMSIGEDIYIFVKDHKKRFCFMNNAFLKALGFRLRDVIGKTDADLAFPPHEVAVFENVDNLILNGSCKHPVISDNERVTARGGGTLTLLTIKMPIRPETFDPGSALEPPSGTDDKPRFYILGIAWDKTRYEQKYEKMQQQYLVKEQLAWSVWDGLLANSSDAIYLKKADGMYVTVNDAFARLVGRPKEEIIGRPTREVFGAWPELLNDILLEDQALITGVERQTRAYRHRTLPNGESRSQSSSKVAITDQTGKTCFILGISRDISNHSSPPGHAP